MSKQENKSNNTSSLIQDKREKFAEDLVYTLNHAIVCGTTDLADPFIGAWTEKKFGKKIEVSLHHRFEHLFEKWFNIHLPHHSHDHGSFVKNLKEWAIGEAVGDIGAVPITMGMQYAAPGVMRGIQYLTEPVFGPVFRWSANRHARHWANEHGLGLDSQEAKDRAEEVYQHEVTHLPHAFVWTGTAAAGNVLTQKALFKGKSIPVLTVGKAAGSVATLVTVLSLRTLAPSSIQKLDEWNAKNLAEPLTRRIGSWFGVDEDTVSRVFEKEREFEDGHAILEKSKKHKGDKSQQENSSEAEQKTSQPPKKQIHSEELKHTTPPHLMRMIG